MNKISGNNIIKGIAIVLTALALSTSLLVGLTVFTLWEEGYYEQDSSIILDARWAQITWIYADLVFNQHFSLENNQISFQNSQQNHLEGTNFYYEIWDDQGQLLVGGEPDFDPLFSSSYDLERNLAYYLVDQDHYQEDQFATYTVKGYVDGSFANKDAYTIAEEQVHLFYQYRYWALAIAISAICLSLILLVFLSISAGKRKDQAEIQLRSLDRMPGDLLLFLTGLFFMAWLIIIDQFDYSHVFSSRFMIHYPYYEFNLALLILRIVEGALLALILIGSYMSLLVQIKSKRLFKNSLTNRILVRPASKLCARLKFIAAKIPYIWMVGLGLLLSFSLEAIVIISALEINYYYFPNGIFILIWFLIKLATAVIVLLIAAGMTVLEKAGQELAAGNLNYHIDSRLLGGRIKQHAHNLNGIGQGMNLALEDKMRSERLKTELITNVSHDIKTPLTSIINYVDLLKKEEIGSEQVKEYIAILDRNSERLKKLADDLVEASKVSTGNMPVNKELIDIAIFLEQTVAEYEDRFKERRLITIVNPANQPLMVQADRRLSWRIMDNLLNNVSKYAQQGTRVYLDLTADRAEARLTIKNISETMLNLSADELMERFIRGDESRTSEGSGLGLSIAKGLAKLQGLGFDLDIDGDLFKVTLVFPLDKTAKGN